MTTSDDKLDLATRAAWLYYVAGNTQDEIAAKLDVSRPAAQRLIALAISQQLIRVQVTRPISACAQLAETLRERFALDVADVVPGLAENPPATLASVAAAAAVRMERLLSATAPTTIAVTSGRALRAMVDMISPMERPQHKIVSVVGSIARDASANRYDVVMRLGDRLGCQCFPRPTPLIADTLEERDVLAAQRSVAILAGLAQSAKATFVGVGNLSWNGPLHADGFITDDELGELSDLGAVGEIGGWAFDRDGQLIEGSVNARALSLSPKQLAPRQIIAIATGSNKLEAIAGALRGRLVTGLVTDEDTARAVLDATGGD